MQNQIRNTEYGLKGLLNLSRAREMYGETEIDNLPSDKYFDTAEVGSFRNSLKSETPTFVGFHGGRTGLTHDMLDSGQFVFESDGVLWATDLGGDSYSLLSYFEEEGYKIYRKRPEGENCVVINPSKDSQTYFGQKIGKSATLKFFESNETSAMAAFNLTDIYARDVSNYTRGYYFGDNRNTLVVQDEINLKESSELYWFMHTSAEIQIIDKNTAVLKKGNKTLRVEVYCNNENFTLADMEAKPLPTSPQVSGQATNQGFRKLAIHFENVSGDILLAVKLIPQNGFYEAKDLIPESIESWTLSDDMEDMSPVFKNAHINAVGMFSADVLLPRNCENALIFLDDKEVADISGIKRCVQHLIKPINVSNTQEVYHAAKLQLKLKNGEIITFAENLKAVQYSEEAILSGLPIVPGISKTENNVGFSVVKNGNEISNTSTGGYVIKKTNDNYIRIQVNPTAGFSLDSGSFLFETSFCLSDYNTTLGFYVKNDDEFCIADTFLENGKSGREFFDISEKINLKAFLDIDNNRYFLMINNVVFKYGKANADLTDITSLFVEIHQNSPLVTEMKIEDLKLSRFKELDAVQDGLYILPLKIIKGDTAGTYKAELNYCNYKETVQDGILVLASYSDKTMNKFSFSPEDGFAPGYGVLNAEISDVASGETIKAMIWNSTSSLTPLTASLAIVAE